MAISSFTSKLSLFCKAGSTSGLDGLSADFHDAGHGFSAMADGVDSVLDRSTSASKPTVFKEPGR
jgi:hypothetical protein